LARRIIIQPSTVKNILRKENIDSFTFKSFQDNTEIVEHVDEDDEGLDLLSQASEESSEESSMEENEEGNYDDDDVPIIDDDE